MSETTQFILVGVIVLITNFQEGITGFGCTALALPFVTLVVGDIELAKHILVPIAYMLAFSIIILSRKHIIWREYLRIVLLAAIGLPIGIWMSKSLPKEGLQWILAVFFALIGIHGSIREASRRTKPVPATGLKKILLSGIVPLGGLMQGAFGSGGPLVVVYAARTLVDKSVFRVTLCLVWFTLNTVLLTDWIRDPRFHAMNMQAMKAILVCMPFTIGGLVLGNYAHHRVNETQFRRMVYAVLAASGAALAWSLLRK